MADFSSELLECAKYSLAHTVTIKETFPLFALQKQWTSSPFSALDDPDSIQFKIVLEFFQRPNGSPAFVVRYRLKLGNCFGPGMYGDIQEKKKLCVQRCKFSIFEQIANEGVVRPLILHKHAASSKSHANFLLEQEAEDLPSCVPFLGNFGFNKPAPEAMIIKCEAVYYGSPGKVKIPALPKLDPCLQNDFLRLYNEDSVDADPRNADVTISVGERKFKAHKAILRARSEYFRTMFASGMRESITNEIAIKEVDPDMFDELLKFVYSGLVPENVREIAQFLLPLADRFGLVGLKSLCGAAIIVEPENCIRVLLLAEAHGCPELARKCVPVIKRNIKTLKATDDWQDLKDNPITCVSVLESLTG